MGYKVALVGATGNVGREMLNILDERKFPADEVVALASRRSVGVEVSYGDRTLKVKALEHYDFSDVDICLMSAGGAVTTDWSTQTKAVYTNSELINKKFPKRIAFNVIPEIDVFMEDGYTKEEWKMMMETKKILDPKIRLTATCVRVPVFVGHSEAVNIEFENPISADEARNILRNAPGCLVIDKHEPGGYVTPYEAAGEDATYISRIREDATVENGLVLWCVSDNLRKGAALNAIQIAESLINRKLLSAKKKAA